ncbi:MAG: helix-turn-helix domain-containing protein [Pseudomonadota bacterium]
MARPRSFDEDTALAAATDLFWARGYDGTGLAELLHAMEMRRGSLYKAWGSKMGLFLACLADYDARHVAPGIALLRGEGEAAPLSGTQRIAALFDTHDPRGCLMCNSIAGIAALDAEVSTRIRARMDDLRDAFAHAFIHDGADPATAAEEAEELIQRYVGMRVGQRLGNRSATL